MTGAMVVGGTLSLPAGIIDNAALASPVVADEKSQNVTGFAVTSTYVTRSTLTFTVPAGFTKMVIVYTAVLEGLNGDVNSTSLELFPFLTRSDGGATGSGLWRAYVGSEAVSGANAVVSVALTDVITALTAAGTVTISAKADTFVAGFGSTTALSTSALVLWMR